MCDTIWQNKDGYSVFLKNSDRAANEPNLCIFSPAGEARGEVRCTYIKIPDKNRRLAVLLVKPSWIWGAEIGINENGVSVGNEAVFTKTHTKKVESLIGMDFVRLGLERGTTAKNAAREIINLLKKFGQGGNCGFDHEFYYDNSYLISDENEAYILETAGRDYAIKQVKKRANISNRLSLKTDFDESTITGDFAKKFSASLYTFFSGSGKRMACAGEKLTDLDHYDLSDYFGILRQHTIGQQKCFEKGSVKSVCMHAGPLLGDHTTGSMVTIVKNNFISVWTTGSSSPCLSVFKPLIFDKSGNFITPPVFLTEEDSLNYWLKREKLNRCIYAGLLDLETWLTETGALESEFIKNYETLLNGETTNDEWHEFCIECSEKERELIDKYANIIDKADTITHPKFWAKLTKKLGKNVFKKDLNERIKL